MNMTKTDYKPLKFENKPLNNIKHWSIYQLAPEGEKDYREKSSFSNIFLNKPTFKMVSNVYDTKDQFQSENYPNLDEAQRKYLEEIGLLKEENEVIPGQEQLKEPGEEGDKENQENLGENNEEEKKEKKVGFLINDGDYREDPRKSLKLEDNNFMMSDGFNKSGFTHKRSHSNMFANNSNGVERILGSNELNFRCTTQKNKLQQIYNNSVKNYEKNLPWPTDRRFAQNYMKDLDNIAKKIETPNHFFGNTPSSNIYVFSKKRKGDSIEGKGIGFESFNVPRTEQFRKSTSDISTYSNVKSHCKTIKHALRVSAGINTPDEYNKKKAEVNTADVELPDDDHNTEVLCKKENMKMKKIIFGYTEQSNFNSKLPTISQIVREPKLKFGKVKKEINTKLMGEKYDPYNFNVPRSNSQRNIHGGVFQY